jgi:hypothetical protein
MCDVFLSCQIRRKTQVLPRALVAVACQLLPRLEGLYEITSRRREEGTYREIQFFGNQVRLKRNTDVRRAFAGILPAYSITSGMYDMFERIHYWEGISMSDIDDKILEALNAEDKVVMDSYGEELGLFDLIRESFRGKLKAVVIPVFLFMLVFAVILVYSAIYFFSTEDIGSKLHWLGIGLTALIVFGLLRLWYWMELNRLSITREVKRLELQVSLLAKKL